MYIAEPQQKSKTSGSSEQKGRRNFMQKLGLASVGGIAASLAGCSGIGGSDSSNSGDQVPTLEVIGYPEANQNRYDALTTIVDEINSLGFDLQYTPMSRDRQLDKVLYQHDFQISSLGYTGRPERLDPNALLWSNNHSSEARDGSYNWTEFKNDEVDAALEAQRSVLNKDERQPLVKKAQQVLMDTPPGEIPIQHNNLINMYNSKRFEGFVRTPGLGLNNYGTWMNVRALTNGGEMTCSHPLDIPDITPLRANELNMITNRLCHDSLTILNKDGLPKPWLAKDWTVSDDNTKIKFTIREGHEFNDGKPCTAEDVVFTYNYIIDKEIPFFVTSLSQVNNVSNSGNVVTFDLNKPDAPIFNDAFSRIHILPEHIWSRVPEETDVSDPFNWSPVESEITGKTLIGSGPYKFDEWRRGEGVRLLVRDNHPVATPDIDSIFLRTIASPSGLTTALRNGEVDFVIDTDADPQVLQDLAKEVNNLKFVATTSVGYDEWAMSTNVSPLDRKSVRAAMAMMIPKQVITEEIWNGFAAPAHSPISPVLEFWYNNDVTKWSDMNREDAIKTLEDDGFTVEDDGIYLPPDGFEQQSNNNSSNSS